MSCRTSHSQKRRSGRSCLVIELGQVIRRLSLCLQLQILNVVAEKLFGSGGRDEVAPDVVCDSLGLDRHRKVRLLGALRVLLRSSWCLRGASHDLLSPGIGPHIADGLLLRDQGKQFGGHASVEGELPYFLLFNFRD